MGDGTGTETVVVVDDCPQQPQHLRPLWRRGVPLLWRKGQAQHQRWGVCDTSDLVNTPSVMRCVLLLPHECTPFPRASVEWVEGGGGGSGTQKSVYQQLPDQIFPIVSFVFPTTGHFGLGRGEGRGRQETIAGSPSASRILVDQAMASWRSVLTRRHSGNLSRSRIRALQCYNCPTTPPMPYFSMPNRSHTKPSSGANMAR